MILVSCCQATNIVDAGASVIETIDHYTSVPVK